MPQRGTNISDLLPYGHTLFPVMKIGNETKVNESMVELKERDGQIKRIFQKIAPVPFSIFRCRENI